MPIDTKSEHIVSFGSYQLNVAQRLLVDNGRPTRLGSRALDILIALVTRKGEVVSKRELMNLVWPDTNVVEANLAVHVTALRRALGDGLSNNRYIVNVPGRGYRFVAPAVTTAESQPLAVHLHPLTRPHNLPARLARLVGRTTVVSNLVRRLTRQRLLTIVGPGGHR